VGWFSKITKVVKKAALAPITVPLKIQTKVAGRLLTAASRAIPGASPFGSARRATSGPTVATPATSYAPASPPPSSSSWLTTAATALNPTVATVPGAAAAVPYVAPAPYSAPSTYTPPAQTYQAPRDTGGEIYTGNAYDPDAPTAGYGMSTDDDRPDDASYYGGGAGPDEELGDASAIDYDAYFSGAAGGLGDWKSGLLSVVKGAASGALGAGASALTPRPKAPTTPAPSAGVSPALLVGGALMVGGGIYMLTRRRAAPVASNPRRRRRRARR
jgi:hypothetical protein